MQTIATLTLNPALDLNTSADRVVADVKIRCDGPVYEPGGGGLNVARVIGRLGGECSAVFASGGHIGRRLGELLADEAVHVRAVPIRETTRLSVTVSEQRTDQQFRFLMPGPRLAEDEWRRCLDELTAFDPAPDFVVASGSLPPGVPAQVYGELAARLRDTPTRLVVDTSGEALRAAARAGVFLLKPNVGELRALVGQDLSTEAELEGAARSLVQRGSAENLVVSLGAAGAFVMTGDLTGDYVRSPTVPIRSRVGAGDSMVAGLVLALARGSSVHDAVRYGVAAGAAAVMTPGSQLCRRDDTERLYADLRGRSAAEASR